MLLMPRHLVDLPQGATIETQIQLIVALSMPSIHQALKTLTSRTRFVALVADSSAFDALDFAKEFNMLSYIYLPISATTLPSYTTYYKIYSNTPNT